MRLMLLVAGFAYAAMPLMGTAALAMPDTHMGVSADVAAPHADGTMAHGTDTPCPHAKIPSGTDHLDHKAVAGGHCSACLTLPPMIHCAELRLAPCTAEAPGLAPRLKSTPATPLERPPRLRG
ncbi:MAG: hypothetical protein Q8S27_17525 [Hoeflea sp.]|nr:hypothetical protein [Hoeflea sp.]